MFCHPGHPWSCESSGEGRIRAQSDTVTSKKGDGLCDGIINNAVCDWDGGDCCPQTTGMIAGSCQYAWNIHCPYPLTDECKCLDPNIDADSCYDDGDK